VLLFCIAVFLLIYSCKLEQKCILFSNVEEMAMLVLFDVKCM